MPIPRKHADNAAKQAAYRERKAAQMAAANAGRTDAELAQAARDLHLMMAYEVSQGTAGAAVHLLIGETPAETLRNIGRYLMPLPPLMPL